MTTSGQMTLREKDMAKEWTAQGVKPRILGYISIGESVPDVITTWSGLGLGVGLGLALTLILTLTLPLTLPLPLTLTLTQP